MEYLLNTNDLKKAYLGKPVVNKININIIQKYPYLLRFLKLSKWK